MKFLSRIFFSFFSNLVAFLLAMQFVRDFRVAGDFITLLGAVALFTLINLLIRPIAKLIFAPVIILTLGFGILIVNALMLYLLDYFSKNVTIVGLEPLAYATLIISAVNIIVNMTARRTYSD